MNQPDQRTDDDPTLTALHQAGSAITRARERFTTAATHLTGARATRAHQLAQVAENLEASTARLIRAVDTQHEDPQPAQPA